MYIRLSNINHEIMELKFYIMNFIYREIYIDIYLSVERVANAMHLYKMLYEFFIYEVSEYL